MASDGFIPQSCPDPLQILDDPFNDKRGPLAGVLAGYRWALHQSVPCQYLLSVPVDTPFFPDDFVTRARACRDDDNEIIVGQFGADKYPTAALWPMAALGGLEKWLGSSDNLSIRGYMTQFVVKTLDYKQGETHTNPFENINHAEDLVQLEMRIRE